MTLTMEPQLDLNARLRASRILAAWNRSNLVELQSLLEESFKESEARSALAREQAELLETVTGTIQSWLRAPSELPEAELQASLSLLRHLSATPPVAHF